ncbi:MAG: hypothetical protein RLZZ22_1014 [Pseudomonadota bacterium]|jgi:hypothetical protein
MPTTLIRYKKYQDPYTTYQLQPPDSQGLDDQTHCTELATLPDGYTYVALPAAVTLPAQPKQITVEPVTLTPELRTQLKAASVHCELIAQRMEDQIRARYSLSDEQYFARIASGAALGIYTFEPGEQEALIAFGQHIEACRQWGRAERARLGL